MNAHLIARIIIDKIRKRLAIEIKCHRCKHIEEKELTFNAPNLNGAYLNLIIIEWRCRNGHLLALIIVGKDKEVWSVKCHRCKHVEEKEVGSIAA